MSNRLVAPHVDDRGAPLLVPELSAPPEQRLVHAHSLDVTYPVGVGFEECFTPAADLVVDRVPIAAQFFGDFFDGTAPLPDLDGRPSCCSGCQQRPRRADRGVLLDEGADRTPGVRACPAAFPPPETNRPAERR